jgi:hypothetical protein
MVGAFSVWPKLLIACLSLQQHSPAQFKSNYLHVSTHSLAKCLSALVSSMVEISRYFAH